MKIDKLKELVLVLIAIILIIFLIKYLNIFKYLKIIFTVLVPVFIGYIYAWIFNPLINKLSLKYNRHFICILLFFMFILLFGLFIYFLVPMFYKEIMEFIQILPDYYSKIVVKVDSLGLKDIIDNVVSFIVDNVPKYLVLFVKNVFKYLGVIIIGLILGLYMSMDYEKISMNFYSFLPKKYKNIVIRLLKEISCEVRKCVNGTLLVAGSVFLLDSLAFFLIGLDSFLLLGITCGITDLIPYVGPYIGGAIAVLVGFTESKFLGVLTLIICFIVQMIENYLLQPIIMSKSIKISPILVMISLLVFGRLFGVIGMLFATPVLAMLKVVTCKVMKVLNKNVLMY